MDHTLTPTEMLRRLDGALALALRIIRHDPALDDCAATQREIRRVIRDTCLALTAVPLLRAKIADLRLAMVGLFEALGAAHVRGWVTAPLTDDVVETSMSGTTLVLAINALVDATQKHVHDRELAFMYYLCLVLGFSGDYARTDYPKDQRSHRDVLAALRKELVDHGWLSVRPELADVAAPDVGATTPAARAPWPLFLALSAAVVTLVTFVLIRHAQTNTLRDLQHAVDESPLAKTGASPRTRR